MNFEPMEATSSNLLREFEDFAKIVSKSSSKDTVERCGQYIQALLSDSSTAISPVLEIMQGLRSDIVPPAVAAAWPSMAGYRKDAYLKWIELLSGKKSCHPASRSRFSLAGQGYQNGPEFAPIVEFNYQGS